MVRTVCFAGLCALAVLTCAYGDEKSLDGAGSAARLDVEARKAAMKGRSLFVGIGESNAKRKAAGLASVWPKSSDARSKDAKDIAGMDFKTSTQYFNELCDMAKYGKPDWSPYVGGVDPSVLSFAERTSVDGKLKTEDVDWLVLKGVTDEMSDVIPVLISANVNPEDLVTSGTFDGASDKPIRLGRANGAAKDLFGNEALVVIRKSGAAQLVKAKYAKQNLLYHKQEFRVSAGVKLEYLRP